MKAIWNIDPLGGARELEDGTVIAHGESADVDDAVADSLAQQTGVWSLNKPKTTKADQANTSQEA